MIPNEQVVITISHAGYIKRTPLSEYKTQNRGGVGQKASSTRNEDFLEYLFVGTNHQYMLFFTQKGKCFWMRVYEIPEGSRTSKGRAIQNLINIEQDDNVKAFICTQDLKGVAISIDKWWKKRYQEFKMRIVSKKEFEHIKMQEQLEQQ